MNNEIIVKGKVIFIDEIQTFNSGFSKRMIVVETDERYPQKLPIEFLKDDIRLLDGLRTGDNVSVSINLQGREYNGRYYASYKGWKILIEEGNNKVSEPEMPAEQSLPQDQEDDFDDVPF